MKPTQNRCLHLYFLCAIALIWLWPTACSDSGSGNEKAADSETVTADEKTSDTSGGAGDADGDTDGDSDTDGDADGDSDGDADSDTDADADSDGDSDGDADTESAWTNDTASSISRDSEPTADSNTESETELPTDSDSGIGACPSLSSYHLYLSKELGDIPEQASGIAWNPRTNTFFIVANLTKKMWQYDSGFKNVIKEYTLENMDFDTEGIVYLGGNRYAIATESNVVYVVEITESTSVVDGAADTTEMLTVTAPPPRRNAGLEGIAFAPGGADGEGTLFAVQEYAPMRVLQFPYTKRTPPYDALSAPDGDFKVDEPWNAETVLQGEVTDLADTAYDTTTDTLLLLSQESFALIRVNPENGDVRETLHLSGSPYFEGLTFFNGCDLAILAEPNLITLHSPN